MMVEEAEQIGYLNKDLAFIMRLMSPNVLYTMLVEIINLKHIVGLYKI